jgi:hypothetical protein
VLEDAGECGWGDQSFGSGRDGHYATIGPVMGLPAAAWEWCCGAKIILPVFFYIDGNPAFLA